MFFISNIKAARYLIMFGALFALSSVYGQHVLYPTIKDLKGSTRSLREVSFTATNNQGKVQKGEELKKVQYLFDSKGTWWKWTSITPMVS